jgi:hypothetical protein
LRTWAARTAATAVIAALALSGCQSNSKSGTKNHPKPRSVTSTHTNDAPNGGSSAPAANGGTCHARPGPLPDANCTPGATNPDVTQDNIQDTICKSGWTSTIRPPTSYTNKLKTQGISAYGYTDTKLSTYEEDHLISLELGGAPSDPKNLWPEPGDTPNPKDKVENDLHRAVCSGRVKLVDAQQAIATDWTNAEQKLGIG